MTSRQWRIIAELAWLVAFAALLFWAKNSAEHFQELSPPTPPNVRVYPTIEFEEAWIRFTSIRKFDSQDTVLQQLGEPTERIGWGGEMQEWEKRASWNHRHLGIPVERIWWKWINPTNREEWFAAFIAGGKVYSTTERRPNLAK